jgi:hypothetical protein
MDSLMHPELQVIGGFLMLAAIFVLRKFFSGAMREAGKEFWLWARRRRSRDHVAGDTNAGSASVITRIRRRARRRSSTHVRLDVVDDRTPCLRSAPPVETAATPIERLPIRNDAAPASHRKCA